MNLLDLIISPAHAAEGIGYTLEIPFDSLDTPDIKIKPRGQMKRRLKK